MPRDGVLQCESTRLSRVAHVNVGPETGQAVRRVAESLFEKLELRVEIDSREAQARDRGSRLSGKRVGNCLADHLGQAVAVGRPTWMVFVQRQVVRLRRLARIEESIGRDTRC